jgi:hypothetical protein
MAPMTPLEPERFPMSEASDPDAVALALETGRALWGQGEAREAVRWLRRAAQQADEAGDDLRALTLARAAADLTTLLDLPLSVPPPPPPPASGSPWDEFQDNTIVDAPTTVSKLVAAAAAVPAAAAPAAAAPAAAASAAVAPAAVAPAAAATPPIAAAPPPPPPPPPATTRSTATLPGISAPPPPIESPIVKPPAARSRAALRVAVSRGDVSGAFAETLLAEGEVVPHGTREALLVPLDPDTDFSSL